MQIQPLTSNPVNYETNIAQLKSQKEELTANRLREINVEGIGLQTVFFASVSAIPALYLGWLGDSIPFQLGLAGTMICSTKLISSLSAHRRDTYNSNIRLLNLEIEQYQKLQEKPSWISRIFHSIFCCC